ncbi:DUF742 domain-containing protein [Streptomyces aculeolatus]|uniref:DUF742 domain-containing protein n=1 Tax=Streptomyces aculeolatus TaxID=270689 RepID=UPI001CED2A59|nr:DUF742 domain-containing protein [Streptomyces aculeolatus]
MSAAGASRPYALAAGRASGAGLSMHTLITARPAPVAIEATPAEWQTVLRWCAGPGVAVAEIAARLGMCLAPTRALLAELLACGLVTCQEPVSADQLADIEILRRVRRGLEAI